MILFSQDPNAYLPVVFTRWQGIELMNYSPPVYCYGQRNVAITGQGTLNGQADANHWWNWKSLETSDFTALEAMADANVPVSQHPLPGAGAGAGLAGAAGRHHLLVVSQDGRPGTFGSVQAALDVVQPGSGPATILIEPGTYWGQIYVPDSEPGITLRGATGNPRDVVLVDDIAHGTVAPNGNQYGTDCGATLSVAGNGFAAYGITVQNSFDPAANPTITIRDTYLPAAINPEQWQNWTSPPFPWQDARSYEYRSTGPGSAVNAGVPQLTAAQAAQYTVTSYLGGWFPRL